eukprot:49012-Rhodomonas_salina.1
MRGRSGHTSCESSIWLSSTTAGCRASASAYFTQRLQLTIGGRLGTVTEAFSVDTFALSVSMRSNSAVTGSASIILLGKGLLQTEHSSAARLFMSACETSAWVSETSMKCHTSSTGGSLRIGVTVGEKIGTLTETLSADSDALLGVPS